MSAPQNRWIVPTASIVRPIIIELLENRRFLSVSVVNGVLTIDDSTQSVPERIVVSLDSNTNNYKVNDNGAVSEFSQGGVDYVDVLGSQGPNYINIKATFPNDTGDNAITGGPGSDTIIGSPGGNTVIFGGNGADSLTAQGQNNIVNGGNGADTIVGGSGGDTLFGDNGPDSIMTGSGANVAVGGAGPDTIIAGTGNDSLYGKSGNDLIIGGGGQNLIRGGKGNDTLMGGAGSSTLIGGRGADVLVSGNLDQLSTTSNTVPASAGLDSLVGGNGRDTLIAQSATDTLSGGPGADEFYAPSGATFTDFSSAQGDFQPSQDVYSGTPVTDISATLRINVHGSAVEIPIMAGVLGTNGDTSIAQVSALQGMAAVLQFSDSVPRTFVLGDFFTQWGVTFSASGIGQYVNGPDGDISMTVNGAANTDFNNYVVKNGDQIVINFG